MLLTVRNPTNARPVRHCTRCSASATPQSRRKLLSAAGGALLAAPLLPASAAEATSVYDFEVMQYGKPVSMSQFAGVYFAKIGCMYTHIYLAGSVLVIVNVASE